MDIDSLRKTKLAENVPGMIYTFLLSPKDIMTFTFVSGQCLEIFEHSPHFLENNPTALSLIIHPEEVTNLNRLIFHSRNFLTPFEWDGKIVTKSGKVKRAWARSTPEKMADGSVEWNGILMDATDKFNRIQELEKTNEELKTAQSRIEEIANNVTGILFEWNLLEDGTESIEYIGKKIDSILAFRPKSLRDFSSLIHPDDILSWQTSTRDLHNSAGTWSFEGRLKDRAGHYRWWRGFAKPHGEKNKARTYHGQLVDVDEKKSREFNERNLRKKFEAILQAVPDMIFIINKEGIFEEFYSSGIDDLSFPKEQFLGKNISFVFMPALAEQTLGISKMVIQDGQIRGLEYELDVRGRLAWFEARFARYDDERVLTVVRNVSDKHFLQEKNLQNQMRLVESARLASLGEMAGGVAHEINNPLAVIVAYTEKLRDSLKGHNFSGSESAHASLAKIESTATRIAKIVSGLRSISRDGSRDALRPTAVGGLIEDAVSLCIEKAKHGRIEIKVVHQDPTLKISCRPVQISQIVLNLLINSIQAVSQLEEKWIQIVTEKRASNLEIRIVDSGRGIPPEIRKKIFDPFFTTKEVGKGTGLGLGISKAIIEDHGGTLILDSDCANTTFVASIPLAK